MSSGPGCEVWSDRGLQAVLPVATAVAHAGVARDAAVEVRRHLCGTTLKGAERDGRAAERLMGATGVEGLASYQHCIEHIRGAWPEFGARRAQRLAQERRHGQAVEKVAEDIVADLFTVALDWQVADLNHQLHYADIVLTRNGVKYVLIETKRPGTLAWHRTAVQQALAQGLRYATEQHVATVAVSDGNLLYATDLAHGGLRDRALIDLGAVAPPLDLWWLSLHGIYRQRPDVPAVGPALLPPAPGQTSASPQGSPGLLHHQYKLPAWCFAYVGDPDRPATWHLPYRRMDGSVDTARLPKAIQAVLSNYRGARVSSVPEEHIPAVLRRLADAAEELGKMPHQQPAAARAYVQLALALEQFDDGGAAALGGPRHA